MKFRIIATKNGIKGVLMKMSRRLEMAGSMKLSRK
jgi:hypothetical protein